MRRTKMQKGITLIALIITIIILLILAVVTIGSIKNSNIITYAQNASSDYNAKKDKEESVISGYEELMTVTTEDIKKASVGKIVNKNSTINGKIYSSENPVIPKGFMAVNVETEGHESYWDAEGGPQVKEGLVISDGTSEFVWIPVPNINEFAKKYDDTNYQGVLYDVSVITSEVTKKQDCGVGTTSNREPANLSAEFDNTSNMSIWEETLYQKSFNRMVASVSKYGGFYVGRYETSFDKGVAQSKSREMPMNNISWHKMYENSLTYSNNNKNLGVISEMIWGCQWDAMLKFILTGNDAASVIKSTNVSHDLSSVYYTGGTNYSGSVTYNDIASNIYDLEGNVEEWTQEALNNNCRIFRGGHYYNGKYWPCMRVYNTLSGYESYTGSRLSLYVDI